jgi:MoaD family protein
MKVIVRYFTVLREITGKREEEIDAKEGSTVEAILSFLNEKYGKKFERYILSGREREGLKLLFLVNGQNIEKLDGLRTKLQNGSILTIIPPVAGG